MKIDDSAGVWVCIWIVVVFALGNLTLAWQHNNEKQLRCASLAGNDKQAVEDCYK